MTCEKLLFIDRVYAMRADTWMYYALKRTSGQMCTRARRVCVELMSRASDRFKRHMPQSKHTITHTMSHPAHTLAAIVPLRRLFDGRGLRRLAIVLGELVHDKGIKRVVLLLLLAIVLENLRCDVM